MTPLAATWRMISASPNLQRSSQVLNVVSNSVYVFGGELKPRQPRDNDVHLVRLDDSDPSSTSVTTLRATPTSTCPSPRVGTASAVIGDLIYFFSGRGGEAMTPIEEKGALWTFNTATLSWNLIAPKDPHAPYPAARSYHALVSDGVGIVYVHAGCPKEGRLADLWSFDVHTRTWTTLADAPAPERGGASIAFCNGLLYRMNGFDGKTEQGGAIDVFNCDTNIWKSIEYKPDGIDGPPPRSVGALLPLAVNDRLTLVTLFGERDPSSLGHAGAGKMLNDIWAFDIESSEWHEVAATAEQSPLPRGWFAADASGKKVILVSGGLGETNERLDDVWTLSF